MKTKLFVLPHIVRQLLSLRIFLLMTITLATSYAYAHTNQSLGDVANNITNSMSGLAKLITAASYVTGVSFAMMGMLKLKAHKDNPVQVPLGQPIVLLIISVGLIFLPNLIRTGGTTLWADQAQAAEVRANRVELDYFG